MALDFGADADFLLTILLALAIRRPTVLDMDPKVASEPEDGQARAWSLFPPARIRIEVRRVGRPIESPKEAWIVPEADVDNPEDGVVADALQDILRQPNGNYRDGFVLREQRSKVEWGGSDGTWDYLLEITRSIPKEVVAAGVGIAMDRIARRLRIRPTSTSIDRTRALKLATSQLTRTFGEPADRELELVAEDHDLEHSRWTFEFRHDGVTYGVEVGAVRRMPAVVHVWRRETE